MISLRNMVIKVSLLKLVLLLVANKKFEDLIKRLDSATSLSNFWYTVEIIENIDTMNQKFVKFEGKMDAVFEKNDLLQRTKTQRSLEESIFCDDFDDFGQDPSKCILIWIDSTSTRAANVSYNEKVQSTIEERNENISIVSIHSLSNFENLIKQNKILGDIKTATVTRFRVVTNKSGPTEHHDGKSQNLGVDVINFLRKTGINAPIFVTTKKSEKAEQLRMSFGSIHPYVNTGHSENAILNFMSMGTIGWIWSKLELDHHEIFSTIAANGIVPMHIEPNFWENWLQSSQDLKENKFFRIVLTRHNETVITWLRTYGWKTPVLVYTSYQNLESVAEMAKKYEFVHVCCEVDDCKAFCNMERLPATIEYKKYVAPPKPKPKPPPPKPQPQTTTTPPQTPPLTPNAKPKPPPPKPGKKWKSTREPLPVYPKKINNYFGSISRQDAEEFLKNCKPGTYLLRWSPNQKFYCVSVVSKQNTIEHWGNIEFDQNTPRMRITENNVELIFNDWNDFYNQNLKNGVFIDTQIV